MAASGTAHPSGIVGLQTKRPGQRATLDIALLCSYGVEGYIAC